MSTSLYLLSCWIDNCTESIRWIDKESDEWRLKRGKPVWTVEEKHQKIADYISRRNNYIAELELRKAAGEKEE